MPHRRRDGSPDEQVELAHLGANEAELVAGLLRSSGIAVELVGVSPFSGEGGAALRFSEGSHLRVRRRDLAAARSVLAQLNDGELSAEELAAQAEAATGTDFGDGAVV